MVPTKDSNEATLVDYFVIAGYDPETGLIVDKSYDINQTLGDSPTGSVPELRTPLQRSFVAKILNHFPQRRPDCPFPDEILPLCMPKGLRFYTEKDVPPKPSIHSFANIREDGSRINGTALTFYEEVKDPLICEAMSLLQQEHVRELTATQGRHERTHLPPGTVSGGTHTLPRGRRDRLQRISYYEGCGNNLLYMSRTICVITRLPLVYATRALLKSFYSIMKSSSTPTLPLESYIYWCLYEVPIPSPGTTLKIPLLDTMIVVQRPGPKELPFFDDSIGKIFEFLKIEKFIYLFSCFLLEHQILLCSKDFQRLMSVCEALLALSFPFRWQMVYVPILPYSQLKFVEAPVPYVMGWCYEDHVPSSLFHSNVCVVDLDTGKAEIPEDVPLFPGANALAADIRNALSRLEEKSNVETVKVDNGEVKVKMRKKAPKRNEEWASKRMSRSFELEVTPGSLTEDLSCLNFSSRPSRSGLKLENLRNNETVTRVAEIARRAGVVVDLEAEIGATQNINSPVSKNYFKDAKVNNAIRECILNRFVEMFYSYEHFVIGGQGCEDRESYEADRESMASFDKASFLSDQPDSHLAFLAAFLETQMFTSFIDAKILSQWETPDEGVVLFDSRITAMRDLLGLSIVRTPTYETTPPFAATEELISKREEVTDYVVPAPHQLAGAHSFRYNGIWPVNHLNHSLLDGANLISPSPSPWRQRYSRLTNNNSTNVENAKNKMRPTSVYGGAGLIQGDSTRQIAEQQNLFVQQLLKETKAKTKRMLVDKMGDEAVQLGHLEAGINGVEENTLVATFCDLLERIWTHGLKNKQGKSALWNFVLSHQDFEKPGLTTRAASTSMLTPDQRFGLHRAPSLPPSDLIDEVPAPVILSPNDNDVFATINDIVDTLRGAEEPWSKSLMRAANFIADKITSADANGNPNLPPKRPPQPRVPPTGVTEFKTRATRECMVPRSMKKSSSIGDFTNPVWEGNGGKSGYASVEGSPRKMRSTSRARSPDRVKVLMSPLPTHLAYDLKNVLRMTEIKTDIGYARAFVRLALERKLLHKHLGVLLSNNRLMSRLYKPYAFIATEEEREQFLFHILSLNAAQFRCFTNTFTKTKMEYQVVIITGTGKGILPAIWIKVEGTLGSGPVINLKSNTPMFKFDVKNLGILSTLRIGHQQTEKPSKWFLKYVLVRNEITGQTYRFPCGRWFGESQWFGSGDDSTLERLLVAEPFVDNEDFNDVELTSDMPFSPSRSRKMSSRSQTPQRERSPSGSRSFEPQTKPGKVKINDVQHQLGEAANALVKYYCSEKRSKSELALLLCGPRGLVMSIEAAFQVGRQESLLSYFRSTFAWDYIERVCSWFFDICRKREVSDKHKSIIHYALRLYRKIDAKSSLGKDGKFHVFILLSIRDKTLAGLLLLMSYSPVTNEMYSQPSFLRSKNHLDYLSKLLHSLSGLNVTVDPSLTYGIV